MMLQDITLEDLDLLDKEIAEAEGWMTKAEWIEHLVKYNEWLDRLYEHCNPKRFL